ncbi:MAG: translation elongation factor Ts [Pseudomonadota bacterium]|nr:translation elongation factor Ts [Pseudomonadota bacterium]
MPNISAENIKLLREKTGAGMMDCKKALVENDGDISKATSWLRKKGIAKAEKKSSRIAAQGLVGLRTSDNFSLLVEINSETDFVSKNTDFQDFVDNVLNIGISKKYSMDSLLDAQYSNNETVAVALQNLVAKIGENIVIRRLSYLDADSKDIVFGSYVHNKIKDDIGRMACVVKMLSSDNSNKGVIDLANKIAMHITALKPLAIDENALDDKYIEKEREIYSSQLKASGKPANIIDKIVDGKVRKYLSEVTLINQNWVLEPSLTVAQVLKDFNNSNNNDLSIIDFKLLILGEGIELEEKSFSEEVASQVKNTT